MTKVRWGVLSTAKIGLEKVIPAMQQGEYSQVMAIASRNLEKAQRAAQQLDIPVAYGSYEELLDAADIDVIYNPLPNPLHVPWSLKAINAGKHVLCEKPIGLSAAEAQELLDAAGEQPHLKVMEAFMYRFHPQWQKARQLVVDGNLGTVQTIQSFFSYFNIDPGNIRNMAQSGGGGLMDIGCYCISLSRFIFGSEPQRVWGVMDYDPEFNTDRLTSAILDFGTGISTFTCGTQMEHFQRVNIVGTEGRVEIEIPFNAPHDVPTRLWIQHGNEIEEVLFEVCNQYTIQGDLFSRAVLEDTEVPTPLQDAVANMMVIDSIIRSAAKGEWV
jgi:predicted dehydrogenase